jgi:hypothetical protein
MLAVVVVAAALLASPSRAATCDLDRIRAEAQQSIAGYDIDAVRVENGIVTLLFTEKDGTRTFAISVRASGTQLFTSVMGVGIDQAELDRVSSPVTMWWKEAELQRALGLCSEAAPDAASGDVGAALRAAVEAALAEHAQGLQHLPRRAALFLGASWIVFALLLFTGDFPFAHTRRHKRLLFALFAFSLLLHWSLSSGGPGDLRLNLTPIWWPSELELRWGPAPIALFRLLGLLFGRVQDTQIIWCNLILSSLLPIVLYRILVELGVGTEASLLAAFVAAAHPLLIAFSGVLERQPTYLFASCGSLAAAIGFLKRGRVRSFIAFLLGTALAVSSRPEGAQVLVVDVAILLLVPASRLRRCVFVALLAFLIPLAYAYIRYGLTADLILKRPTFPVFTDLTRLLWTFVFNRDFTPLAWIIAWTAGLVLGIRRPAAWVAIAAVVGLHLVWTSTGVYGMFVGYERQVAGGRYQSILLVPFVIGTGLFIDECLKTNTGIRIILAVAVVAFTSVTLRRPYDTLLRPFTVDYEYRFLRQHTLELSPDSHLYILQSPVDDIGFVDARFVGHFLGSPVHFGVWGQQACKDLAGDPKDAYLYIGSSCAPLLDSPTGSLRADYMRWMKGCTAIRNQVAANAVAEIDVPARKMLWYDYQDSTARLGLYRLKDLSICALDLQEVHLPLSR